MIHRFVLRDRKAKPSEARLFNILRSSHVTEKTTRGAEMGHYTFLVARDANKFEIAAAVKRVFGVDVVSVNTVVLKGKEKRFRGRLGTRQDRKKAIVRIKEGQSLALLEGSAP